MSAAGDIELLHFALNSKKRVVSFSEISDALNIPLQDVALYLIKAIAKGTILGRIDAEASQLVINSTIFSEVTPTVIKQAVEGLRQIEKQLGDELELSKTAQKWHHSSVQ